MLQIVWLWKWFFSVTPTMGNKMCGDTWQKNSILKHLGNISHILSLPSKTMLIFLYFLDCTDHRAYTTLNWGAGGIGDLTLEANTSKCLNIQKVSFSQSFLTTFYFCCPMLFDHQRIVFLIFFYYQEGQFKKRWLLMKTSTSICNYPAKNVNENMFSAYNSVGL